MAKIMYMPKVKISRNLRKIIDATQDWESKGFSREVSAAAASICMYVDRLERRVKRLEKKNSKCQTAPRIRINKSSIRKLKSTKGE